MFAVNVNAFFLTTLGTSSATYDESRVAFHAARVFLADRIAVTISGGASVDAERAKGALSVRTAQGIGSTKSGTASSAINITDTTLKKQADRIIAADDVVFLRDVASDSCTLDCAVTACIIDFICEAHILHEGKKTLRNSILHTCRNRNRGRGGHDDSIRILG